MTAKRNHLIQNTLSIAHSSHRHSGNSHECFLIDFYGLSHTNFLEFPNNQGSRDRTKLEPLASGNNRWQNFMRLRRSKDKFHMRRRFFQSFKKGIKCLLAKHMHLIDYIYFKATLGRCILAFIPQITHLLHGVIRCTVNLDHIKTSSFHDGLPYFGVFGHLKRRSIFPI